jgi:hypothetical protein
MHEVDVFHQEQEKQEKELEEKEKKVKDEDIKKKKENEKVKLLGTVHSMRSEVMEEEIESSERKVMENLMGDGGASFQIELKKAILKVGLERRAQETIRVGEFSNEGVFYSLF